MERLSWRSILQRVEGRRITGLWYGVEDGYLRLELDDGSVMLVAATWEEGCHVVDDPAVPATRKGRRALAVRSQHSLDRSDATPLIRSLHRRIRCHGLLQPQQDHSHGYQPHQEDIG